MISCCREDTKRGFCNEVGSDASSEFSLHFSQFDTLFPVPGSNSLTVVTTSAAVTAYWGVLVQGQPWCDD